MTRKLSHRSLLVWSTLALASGCGQILGISDYKVDPALDDEAPSGKGGEDSAEGGDTSSGTSGRPGAAGSAGKGGAATAGSTNNDAGATGEAGAPPVVVPSKFTGCNGKPFVGNEAIIRSCVLRTSCEVWRYPDDSISRCVSQNTQAALEGTKCTLDAASCADVTKCDGTRIENKFCIGKADGQYCNGNEIVTCGDFPWARDCAKDGGKCHDFGVKIDEYGNTVDCALDDVKTCTVTDATERCGGPSNAYKYQCEGAVAFGTKCTNFAASCQERSATDAGCYYGLNTCDEEGVTCTNGRATWCDGETQLTYDCGSVGLGCQTVGDYIDDGGRQCTAPGCAPSDIEECEESCSGSKLKLCYGGAPVTVDCKDYGFKTCLTDDYDCKGLIMGDCTSKTDVIHYAYCE